MISNAATNLQPTLLACLGTIICPLETFDTFGIIPQLKDPINPNAFFRCKLGRGLLTHAIAVLRSICKKMKMTIMNEKAEFRISFLRNLPSIHKVADSKNPDILQSWR